MSRTLIDRRTVLRGLLGGAAVTVGLPPLERFFTGNGDAYAADCAPLPQRFGLFFWGNGVHPDAWTPTAEGADFPISPILQPFAHLKEKISVVSGMKVLTGNPIAHWSGVSGMLCGAALNVRGDEHRFKVATLDQQIAQAIGGETRFRSIETGNEPGGAAVSQSGPDAPVPFEADPARLFERLFGGSFTAPGEEPIRDPKLALRRSVLDAVRGDANRLKMHLGSGDKARLDQHLTGIRELERRIALLEANPPDLAACVRPDGPPGVVPDIDGRPQTDVTNRVIADLVAMALACDQTRVFSHVACVPVSDILYPEAPMNHHRLTHDEQGAQPEVRKIIMRLMGDLAYFLDALNAIDEGAGTVLDHTVVLGTTDCAYGQTHAVQDYPILLAGGACGRIKTGIHYRSPAAESVSHVGLSLLRAMGVQAQSFGVDAGKVTEGLSAIEVAG